MNKPQTNIAFAYAVGDKIQERMIAGHIVEWRDSIVVSLAPYRGKPGYYTRWDPLPTDGSSQGGWTYEACMRRRGG